MEREGRGERERKREETACFEQGSKKKIFARHIYFLKNATKVNNYFFGPFLLGENMVSEPPRQGAPRPQEAGGPDDQGQD